jgi:hypothetical protein
MEANMSMKIRKTGLFCVKIFLAAIFCLSGTVFFLSVNAFAQLNPEMSYLIINKHSQKALDVAGGSTQNSANVQQFDVHGKKNQQWTFKPSGFHNGSPVYLIVNVKSSRALDVKGSSREDGANVVQYEITGNKNQLWQIFRTSGPYYRIQALHSGKCLDVTGWNTKNGGNVAQHNCSEAANQQWKITPAGGERAGERHPVSGTAYMVVSSINQNVLEVEGGSSRDGANVKIFESHGGQNQLWRFLFQGNYGTEPVYILENVKSKKCLDVKGGSVSDGANVQIYRKTGNDNQRWKMVKENDFFRLINVKSKKCLDVSRKTGNVQQFKCHGGENQKWRMTR